jgi:proteasome alpha subunit
MLTPYDFQENLQQRAQYIRNRLQAGSPVIGISYDNGIMLLTTRRRGRKVFEIYDRLMLSAIGNQADVETLRVAAIDFAHQEGFVRSPDDVTVQRVVGFALSPALKKAFGDPLTTPFVVRALFAELHDAPERDLFYILNYDGEFNPAERFAVIAGTTGAEDLATRYLRDALPNTPTLEKALSLALVAWASHARQRSRRTGTPFPSRRHANACGTNCRKPSWRWACSNAKPCARTASASSRRNSCRATCAIYKVRLVRHVRRVGQVRQARQGTIEVKQYDWAPYLWNRDGVRVLRTR